MGAHLLLLGACAGTLTTITGVGGGMLLVLALSVVEGPHAALAMTAPALLLGNLHRATMFRADLDRRVAGLFVAGALPGSVLGGLFAASVAPEAIRVLLVLVTGLAAARQLGWWRFEPSARHVLPLAALTGALGAMAGGAGLLVAPLLLAMGLSGRAFVATGAVVAVAMHVGRLAAYAVGGMITADVLVAAAVLAAAILAGNLAGERARARIGETWSTRLSWASLLGCVAVSLAGLR